MWSNYSCKDFLRAILLLAGWQWVAACSGNQRQDMSVSGDSITHHMFAEDTDTTELPPAGPLNIEIAETQVSVYYSRLNQEAGYPLYKGLLIKIDTILPGVLGNDTSQIKASVQGRRRLQSGSDSTTEPFQQKLRLKTFPKGSQWDHLFAQDDH